MTKVTLLNYINVTEHKHFFPDVPLETLFERSHHYTTAEISILSGSEYKLNPDIEISVANKYVIFRLGPYQESFSRYKIWVNGLEFWNLAGADGYVSLTARDLIEIVDLDKENDTLTHQTIVITSVTK